MFRSIRVKLTIWYVFILGLVFAALAVGTFLLFVRVTRDETRTNIGEMGRDFVALVNRLHSGTPKNASAEKPIKEAIKEFNFHDYQFAVYSSDGRLIDKTINAEPPSNVLSKVGDDRLDEVAIGGETYASIRKPFRVDNKNFELLVFFSMADQDAVESRIANIFLFGAPVLLLVAGLGGYFLARQSLKPIAIMGERAKQIGASNIHERLPVANPDDEIGNLASLFNQLLDRLDQAFDGQRRFMADASHELRTPLAIVRGESEVALQKEGRSDEEYRESLRIVNDEGKRLSKIVEDLFTLARVDSGSIAGSFRELYVDEIVGECLTRIRTLAEKRKIKTSFESEELIVQGDEALLDRLFLNLLDNALKYNLDDGSIRVVIKGKTVSVANTGADIPEKEKELIFERFYRIDKAHSRQAESLTSGAGLGLSIARWIANIHGATLELTRSDCGENIFSVTFKS